MDMYSPPHPGEFIKEVYLESLDISYRKIAKMLKVAPSTFNRLINGQSSISSEMALRLSKTLGRSPESWLIMQNKYNLWHTRKKLNLEKVEKLDINRKRKQYA